MGWMGAVGGGVAGTFVSPGAGTVGGAMLGSGLEDAMGGAGNVSSGGGTLNMNWDQYNQANKQQNQARMSQDELASMLKEQAAGRGPSVANAQLQQSLAQNQAAQAASANSARGGVMAQAAAQRQAQVSGAQMSQQSAQQASTNHASEAMGAQQQLQGLYNTQRSQDLGAMGTHGSTTLGVGSLQNQHDQIISGEAQATAQNKSGLAGGMISGGLGLLSDERAKTNIHPADADVRQFLDALASKGPKSFEYKHDPGGEHFGVMAQDLESAGPVGRSIVKDDPRTGFKTIDTTSGFGALLAANAQLEERLAKLESHKKGGK